MVVLKLIAGLKRLTKSDAIPRMRGVAVGTFKKKNRQSPAE